MSRFVLRPEGFVELNAPGGIVDRGVAKAAGKLRDDAKGIITREGRVDTGAMRQGIKSYRIGPTTYRVSGSTDHDRYQHDGIGPVLPRRAKVLRFKPKGGSAYIFRPRTQGFSGIHFLTRALARLTVRDFS